MRTRRLRFLARATGLWILLASTAPGWAEITLRGRVSDEEGAGIEESRVRLFAALDERDAALIRLTGTGPEPVAVVAPGSDGRFEIEAPEAGMWRLEAGAPEHLTMRLELVPLLEDRTLPELELPRREKLTVRVLAGDGDPIAGAWVRAARETPGRRLSGRLLAGRGPGWLPAERLARSDEMGRVTFDREADEKLTLRAGASGWVESEELITRSATATLRLTAGKPVAVTAVAAVDRDRKGLEGVVAFTGKGRWPQAAGPDGRLALAAPPAGKLAVELLAPGGLSYRGSVSASDAGPEPLVLELGEPRRVAGRVLDDHNRWPLPGALVWSGREPAGFVRADGSGGFTLAVTQPGGLWLQGAHPGYRTRDLEIAENTPLDPVIALAPAAQVRGRVVDANGGPIAHAEVGVRLADTGSGRMFRRFGLPGRLPRTRTDTAGRFRLSGIEPASGYVVFARHPDFAAGETPLPDLPPLGSIDDVRISLDTGARIVGRVLDPARAPVAGARVSLEASLGGSPRRFRAMMRTDADGEPAETSTGPEGDFELARVAPGSFDLIVRAPGFSVFTAPGIRVEKDAGEVDAGVLSLEPGVELAGRVVDDAGTPIEGAEVWGEPANPINAMRLRFLGGDRESDARSAADGHFALPDRTPGERIDLLVRLEGYSAGILSGVEVPAVDPVEIVLEPASSLSGRVVDERGEPVAMASVQAVAEGGGATSGGRVFMMTVAGFAATDPEGEFEIEDIEPGTLRLNVSARGFRDTEISNVEVPKGEDVTGLEIELLEGSSVSGRVRSSDGRPVTGAQVAVFEQPQGMGRVGGLGATTDGDGVYFLQGVEPGPRLIRATHEDEGEVTLQLDVEEGDNSLDLTFEGGVEVHGRVLDEAGTPLAGAAVFLDSPTRGFRGGSEVLTSADGSFTLAGIRDGTYSLGAQKVGFAQPRERVEVEVAGAPIYGLEVRLGAGGAITGRIRGLEPAQLLTVDIWASSPGSRFLTGQVRHDGTYRVEDVGAGDWSVSARAGDGSGQARGRVTLEPGQPEALLDLEFGGGLRVTGRVLMGSEPVAGISVGVSGIDVRSHAAGVTNRDGRFSLAGLEPGRHRVEVMDFASGIQHTEEHELLSERDLVIELAVGRVSGRVVDTSDSSPIAGAVVRLEPVAEVAEFRRFMNRGGSTDADGVFSVHNVSTGDYRLVAEKDGYSPAERSLRVEPDRRLEGLVLRLQPTDGVSLRVFLPTGRPPDQVWVAVRDGGGGVVVSGDYPVDQEGRLRLTTVPAGSWRIFVAARGTGVASQPAVAPGDAGDVRLPPEARVDVRVADLAEDPAVLTVEAFGADGLPAIRFRWGGQIERHWRGSRGRARLDGLAPGEWRIRASAPDGRSWERTVTLGAGENPVLTLE